MEGVLEERQAIGIEQRGPGAGGHQGDEVAQRAGGHRQGDPRASIARAEPLHALADDPAPDEGSTLQPPPMAVHPQREGGGDGPEPVGGQPALLDPPEEARVEG
jgi:hypothetical protein